MANKKEFLERMFNKKQPPKQSPRKRKLDLEPKKGDWKEKERI